MAVAVDAAVSETGAEAGSDAGADADAEAGLEILADEVDVTDAGPYQAIVDSTGNELRVPPWFFESRTADRRAGECGGEESDIWTLRDSHNLISRGGFKETCGGSFVAKPIFLQHSLAGGAFSMRDAVARKFLDDACASSSLETEDTDALPDFGTAIPCARAHGATAAAVTRKLRKICSAFSDSCELERDDAGKVTCPAWTLALAKGEPPR
jgi:hypothetical protein